MAAPSETTLRNLTGQYVMNKSLSDDVDAMLTLQGIGWLTRKAIAYATVNLTIKEYKDGKGHIHIDITSVASGLSTSFEGRTLDWTDRPHDDKIFGKVHGKSRFFKDSDFHMESSGGEDSRQFLLARKLKDGKTDSRFLEDEHLQSWIVNDHGGWTVEQIWGFEEIQGKRYCTRRVVARKGDKGEKARLVYDYKGPVASVKDVDNGLAYGEDK